LVASVKNTNSLFMKGSLQVLVSVTSVLAESRDYKCPPLLALISSMLLSFSDFHQKVSLEVYTGLLIHRYREQELLPNSLFSQN
jgi:hypothetical protein